MAVTSTSGVQSAGSGILAQIELQQARQAADQAEQQAAALQARAQAAQAAADRAQENARSLQVQSKQAQGSASQARMNLVTQTQLGDLQVQIRDVLTSDTLSPPVTVAAAPVINTSGQETGKLVNVVV